ncbi:MAG TPA: SDR family NAD(P)-dependent oxidoreductase [Thermoanaerobaculia bacterium]|nr:SDR family NAD(P)-dependent oxidoreductase [Thermoanaerobaculia bacterium]
MNIEGRTFLISGGGSGLGAATARLIARSGGNVVVADLNPETGAATAHGIGERARFVETDVTSEAAVAAAITAAEEAFGGLDGAVSCAGIGAAIKTVGKDGPHPLDVFERVIGVNLIGTFNVVRLTAAAILRRLGPRAKDDLNIDERGVLINTASVAAFDGQIGQAAYSASKGAVVGMTLPIARDLAREGIRCVTIAPGLFDTPLLAGLPEPARRSLETQVPFPSRLGQPDEYAHLVKAIIENPMLNGEVIRLDGAIRMAPR